MKHLIYLVNPSFLLRFRFAAYASFCEGPNYSKASAGLASDSFQLAVWSPFFADCRNRMAHTGAARYTCIMLRVKAVHVSYA
jgi:hypothetical protein